MLCACSGAISLDGTGVQVRGNRSPFSLSIRDGAGREVAAVLPPSATHDAWRWEDQLLGGWDGFRSSPGAALPVQADVSVSGSRVRISLQTSGNEIPGLAGTSSAFGNSTLSYFRPSAGVRPASICARTEQ